MAHLLLADVTQMTTEAIRDELRGLRIFVDEAPTIIDENVHTEALLTARVGRLAVRVGTDYQRRQGEFAQLKEHHKNLTRIISQIQSGEYDEDEASEQILWHENVARWNSEMNPPKMEVYYYGIKNDTAEENAKAARIAAGNGFVGLLLKNVIVALEKHMHQLAWKANPDAPALSEEDYGKIFQVLQDWQSINTADGDQHESYSAIRICIEAYGDIGRAAINLPELRTIHGSTDIEYTRLQQLTVNQFGRIVGEAAAKVLPLVSFSPDENPSFEQKKAMVEGLAEYKIVMINNLERMREYLTRCRADHVVFRLNAIHRTLCQARGELLWVKQRQTDANAQSMALYRIRRLLRELENRNLPEECMRDVKHKVEEKEINLSEDMYEEDLTTYHKFTGPPM